MLVPDTRYGNWKGAKRELENICWYLNGEFEGAKMPLRAVE
jgi:hypothetical protein